MKKMVKTIIVALFAAATAVGTARAAYTGGQPGQFLAWGAGGRSLGMGRAFFAVADAAVVALRGGRP